MEIGIILTLLEKFQELVELNNDSKRETYKEYILPIYEMSERVMNDYNDLTKELVSKINRGESRNDIIKWLEERRFDLQPVRERLKLDLDVAKLKKSDEYFEFKNAVFDLMRGHIEVFENGHFATEKRLIFRDHTVLNLLSIYEYQNIATDHNRVLQGVNRQHDYLLDCWRRIVSSHNALKEKFAKK